MLDPENELDRAALAIARYMDCSACPAPCKAKTHSSMANCVGRWKKIMTQAALDPDQPLQEETEMRGSEFICRRCGQKTVQPIRLLGCLYDFQSRKFATKGMTTYGDLCQRCVAELIGWMDKAEVKIKSNRDVILELYLAGKSLDEIEQITGVNVAAVSRIVEAEGLRDRYAEIGGDPEEAAQRLNSSLSKMSPEQMTEIKRLRELGLSQQKIAEHIGVSRTCVRECLARMQKG